MFSTQGSQQFMQNLITFPGDVLNGTSTKKFITEINMKAHSEGTGEWQLENDMTGDKVTDFFGSDSGPGALLQDEIFGIV